MRVTLLPIVTLVRLATEANASVPDVGDAVGDRDAGQVGALIKRRSPMLVTGKPLRVLGMVTAPPAPVYPVMVTVPLVIV